MSSEPTIRRGVIQTLWARKWRLIVPAVIGAGASAVVSAVWPVRYVSQTTIQLVPPRIGSDYVRSATTPLEDRLQAIRMTILSRTRLERIVNEFNLYADERRHGIMEEIIDGFRNNVDVRILTDADGRGPGTFRVAFTGADPRTVAKVTEKLSSLFVDESLSDRRLTTQGTVTFLESQIEDTGKRLTEFETKMKAAAGKPTEAMTIEFDVLREHYRSLLQKRHGARLAANLEARAIGEQFRLIDPASFPEKPVGPSRTVVNLMGAGAGLMMGLVLVAAAPRRKPQPGSSTH